MRTPLKLIHPALLAGLLGSTACGGKVGTGADGGVVGSDAPSGDSSDGRTMGLDSDSGAGGTGTMDGASISTPDAPFVGTGGADGGGRDWVGGDRAYLPAHSPDGSIPDCIWALLRQCCGAPGDRCAETISDGGLYQALCWPTGQRETFDNEKHITSGYNSDGTLCFREEVKPGLNGYALYDGAGQEIATYVYAYDGTGQFEVSCDGATFRSTLPLECSRVLGECYVGYCPL
jgi:hypothetical protein